MNTYRIEWCGKTSRNIGFHSVEAETLEDAKTQWELKYGERGTIRRISRVTTNLMMRDT